MVRAQQNTLMRRLPLVILVVSLLLWSCGPTDTTERIEVDKDTVATMITDSVNSFISDSGIVRYHLVAPIWKMFDEASEPYWYFPQGISLEQYDDKMTPASTLVSDTARYFSAKKLWKLDGNVRMRNVDGDKFLTEQMFWDQRTHKVYSDSFIHIERGGRTIEGYGFVSNEQITAYTIRRPVGIFPTEGFTTPRE
ncbi:MAG: LPS export ABC transporter periplasmic protein LptC [Bacteroides sp.]|nr:LPS export ABC transporter periplasmic protein LptC [Bacteroides sp.]MCM1378871.1 LPS export ABC transporter periplasmic protein LptC [Bacteroides sp.]MCM1445487.1 LPS export ABC transporter periplasmic protein LptC [Prevotella sp.]